MSVKTQQSKNLEIPASTKVSVGRPKLRFPGFSGAWKEKMLGDVSNFFSGGTPTSTNKKYYSGVIPFIKSGEISCAQTEQFITDEAINLSSAKRVNRGDLLYALYGATSGVVAISKMDGAINQAVLCIRTNEDKNWLYNYLNHKKGSILAKYLQGGQGNLSADIVKKMKIFFPLLSEQQKIAEFLGATDEWLENLRAQKESLESYKKGMMQKIFSQEIRFKDDNGKDFLEWEENRLGDICDYKNGGSFEENVVDDGKYNLITLNSIDIGGNIKNDHKKVNDADWFLQKGDLVMVLSDVAHGNFLGLVDIIPEDDRYVLNQRMGLLRKEDNEVDLSYLRKYINIKQRYFKLHGQGSSQQNLSKGDILKFKVFLPELKEQQKIAEFLTSLDNLINLKQKQITQAEQWKNGLMQELFV